MLGAVVMIMIVVVVRHAPTFAHAAAEGKGA